MLNYNILLQLCALARRHIVSLGWLGWKSVREELFQIKYGGRQSYFATSLLVD